MGIIHNKTEKSSGVREEEKMQELASLRQGDEGLRKEVSILKEAMRSSAIESEPYPSWIAWLRRMAHRWGLFRIAAATGVITGLWLNYTAMRDDRLQFAQNQKITQQQFLAGQDAALTQAKVSQQQFDEDRKQYLIAQKAVLIGTLYNRIPCLEKPCSLAASTRARKDAVVALFDLGERDFANVDLSGAILSGVNLPNADLSSAMLNNARVGIEGIPDDPEERKNMVSANWKNVNLSRANFDHAYMVAMILEQARLDKASGKHADLSFANLTDATLSYANLSYADLSNSVLMHANFSGATMKGVSVEDANLQGADLTDADLTNALMHRSDLRGVFLSNVKLNNARLIGVDLRNAEIGSFTDLKNADLTGANLRGVDLSCWKLEHVKLAGADLEAAIYGPYTTFPSNFQPDKHGMIYTKERPDGKIGCLR